MTLRSLSLVEYNITLPVVRVRHSSWCRSDTKKKCNMVDINDADGKPKLKASPKSKLLPSNASSFYVAPRSTGKKQDVTG
jgi:hypothetical protein